MGINDLPTWNPSEEELEKIRKEEERRKKAKQAQAAQIAAQPAPTTTPAPTNVGGVIAAGQDNFTTRFEAGEEDTTEDSLVLDQDFLAAARNVYSFNSNGRKFEGSDQELADYALDTMGWFNYNLPKMTLDAASG